MSVDTDKKKLEARILEAVQGTTLTRTALAEKLGLTSPKELSLLDAAIEELIREGHCARRPNPLDEPGPERFQPIGVNPINLFGKRKGKHRS